MDIEEGRAAVRRYVAQRLSDKDWNPIDLQRATGINASTVGDFLNGKRWPRAATRSKISRALGWEADGIDEAERTGVRPIVTAIDEQELSQDVDLGSTFEFGPLPPGALDGVSAVDIAEAANYAQAMFLAKLREIKRERES